MSREPVDLANYVSRVLTADLLSLAVFSRQPCCAAKRHPFGNGSAAAAVSR
jgi:hypothetical protein